jgi:hypothetical protein
VKRDHVDRIRILKVWSRYFPIQYVESAFIISTFLAVAVDDVQDTMVSRRPSGKVVVSARDDTNLPQNVTGVQNGGGSTLHRAQHTDR